MADVNEVSIPSPSCDWRGVRLCLARGCWEVEYLFSANGGESVELRHQLKMWPSQTAKRPTRSSAAWTVVCLHVLDGRSGVRTCGPAAKRGLVGMSTQPHQSCICWSGPWVRSLWRWSDSLSGFFLTLSLPTVLRFTTNSRKEDGWHISSGVTLKVVSGDSEQEHKCSLTADLFAQTEALKIDHVLIFNHL